MESKRSAHEIGPKKGSVTSKDGQPTDVMATTASYYPLLAKCWTCDAKIELISFYGLWHHVDVDAARSIPASDG